MAGYDPNLNNHAEENAEENAEFIAAWSPSQVQLQDLTSLKQSQRLISWAE